MRNARPENEDCATYVLIETAPYALNNTCRSVVKHPVPSRFLKITLLEAV